MTHADFSAFRSSLRISDRPMKTDRKLVSSTAWTGESASARIGTSRIAIPNPVNPRTKAEPNAASSAAMIAAVPYPASRSIAKA